jgi:CubicO group peptidase (beta-lactamase class C family)
MNVVPETRFHIVSVTKTLVATVLARLHGKGRISFDDPVAKHVPEVQGAKWSETVTLRHLLANTAGLPLRIAWDQGTKPRATTASRGWQRRSARMSSCGLQDPSGGTRTWRGACSAE